MDLRIKKVVRDGIKEEKEKEEDPSLMKNPYQTHLKYYPFELWSLLFL